MGKKYIIELEERPFYSGDPMVVGTVIMAERLYRVKGFKSLVFDETGLSKLTPYEEPTTQEKPFDFSERLSEAMTRFWEGSSEQFAEACEVSWTTMNAYLSGYALPGLNEIARMARVLNCSADYLVGLV